MVDLEALLAVARQVDDEGSTVIKEAILELRVLRASARGADAVSDDARLIRASAADLRRLQSVEREARGLIELVDELGASFATVDRDGERGPESERCRGAIDALSTKAGPLRRILSGRSDAN